MVAPVDQRTSDYDSLPIEQKLMYAEAYGEHYQRRFEEITKGGTIDISVLAKELRKEYLKVKGAQHRNTYPKAEHSTRDLEQRLRDITSRMASYNERLFEVVMGVMMKVPGVSEVPLAYYVPDKRILRYTPAAARLLGAKNDELDGETLTTLLRYIHRPRKGTMRETNKQKRALLGAIREGKALVRQHYQTNPKQTGNKRQLYLTTVPQIYNSKFMGLAIFLRDPPHKHRGIRNEENLEVEAVTTTLQEVGRVLSA
jgi:PAS domain-containing protein